MADELTVTIEGARETLRAIGRLGKDANAAIRDAATELAGELAGAVQRAGRAEGRQAGIVADTVRSRRDRVPVIQAGGAKRIGRNRAPAGKLVFGSEFGSHLPQFRPHLGRGSYWFYRTVEDAQAPIAAAWARAADEVARKFSEDA